MIGKKKTKLISTSSCNLISFQTSHHFCKMLFCTLAFQSKTKFPLNVIFTFFYFLFSHSFFFSAFFNLAILFFSSVKVPTLTRINCVKTCMENGNETVFIFCRLPFYTRFLFNYINVNVSKILLLDKFSSFTFSPFYLLSRLLFSSFSFLFSYEFYATSINMEGMKERKKKNSL